MTNNSKDNKCHFCGAVNVELKELPPSKPQYDRGIRTRLACEICWRGNLRA